MVQQSVRGLEKHLRSMGRAVVRYGNASHGFKDVLIYLREKSGITAPNVIMPSLIPAKLYRTLVAAGYEPRFYDIFGSCRFDPQQIEELIDDRTTSIFVVHYFGHPAEMASLLDISARKGVTLIEDCAHVLLASVDGKPLGTFGDFSIFSPRKMLQLSDGGLLLMSKEHDGFKATYDGRVRGIYTTSKFLLSRAKRFYLWMSRGNDFLRTAHPPKVGWIDPRRKAELRVREMSRITAFVQKTTNLSHNSATRKRNYIRLAAALKDFGFLIPLYNQLPDRWTPYSLPMLVDAGSRPLLQAELLKYGISSGLGWPESPYGIQSARATSLSSRLIEFPIHPLVIDIQFEKIVDACRAFERKYVSGIAEPVVTSSRSKTINQESKKSVTEKGPGTVSPGPIQLAQTEQAS